MAFARPSTVVEGELATAEARASGPHAAGTAALRHAAARRKRFEAMLDAGHGECLLRRPEIAAIVENALLYFDGARYQLHAWCVMPNHVHVLVTPLAGCSLSMLLHSWKSFTAKAINAALGRRGPVWFEEYFDRRIRDEAHYAAALAYIENNPSRGGALFKGRGMEVFKRRGARPLRRGWKGLSGKLDDDLAAARRGPLAIAEILSIFGLEL